MTKTFTSLLTISLFFIFLQKANSQDQLHFTALESEGYGVYASVWGHNLPSGLCGLAHAYYNLVSPDNAGLPGYNAAMHLVPGGTGFANFNAALTANGYTIDQVEMSFTDMTLGNDITPNDWFFSNDEETRFYRGGTFLFKLDGEPLVSGNMPTVRIIIDYNNYSNCFDDVISGHTQQTDMADASGGSSAGVQAVAAALLQDVGDYSVSMNFSGMQPAAQGFTGAVFEATSGTITLGSLFNTVFQSTNISQGMVSQCMLANQSVTSSASGDWLHIENNNDLVCSILDTENMGVINSSIYINTGNVRTTSQGVEYLDRNFEISVTQQPANPVRVRIYFKTTEWEDFIGANDNDGNDIENLTEMKVTKFGNSSCSNSVNNSGGELLDILEWGTSDDGNNYYIDVEVNSFSSFFLHGGQQAVLPVELVYFSAKPNTDGVMLEWATALEKDNWLFEIEKSHDGLTFYAIGQQEGSGQSEDWKQYRFQDYDVNAGETYYYRLRQIDYDGSEEYSSLASVRIPGNQVHAEVFPNPMSSHLSVKIPEGISLPVTVELVSVFGHSLVRRTFEETGQYQLQTAGLSNGIYEVVFSNGTTKWVVGKVVK